MVRKLYDPRIRIITVIITVTADMKEDVVT